MNIPFVLDDTRNEIETESTPMLANTPLNALLLADDLAIFSLSKERLQAKLNLLKKYCLDGVLKSSLKRLKLLFLVNKKRNQKVQISLQTHRN